MRAILIAGIVALAAGVWWAAVSVVRANWRARREWRRVTGMVTSVANPVRPIVRVERGIEFTSPPPHADGPSPYEPDERVLEMESDEGLRHSRRVEFLIDPASGRARVAGGVGFSPFLLALLGLVYLALAGGFFLVTWPAPEPGRWTYYQAPPWSQPALLSARYVAWPTIQFAVGAAVLLFGVAMTWTSPVSSLAKRAGMGSAVLLVAGIFIVLALDRATYRIEADLAGLRESSALGWRMAPWGMLRGAVDETVSYRGRRSSRSQLTLDHVTRRVYFTDDSGQEVVAIDDALRPEQAKAILDYVLSRTNLRPEKRERNRLMFSYRQ